MKRSTEKMENVRSKHTPIIMEDWKVNVYSNSGVSTGYRRYHRHGEDWYCVIIVDPTALESYNSWMCGECNAMVPDEMEGYINLMRWAKT